MSAVHGLALAAATMVYLVIAWDVLLTVWRRHRWPRNLRAWTEWSVVLMPIALVLTGLHDIARRITSRDELALSLFRVMVAMLVWGLTDALRKEEE